MENQIKKKPLSLADRIALQNIKNTPLEETVKEEKIISLLVEPDKQIKKPTADTRSGQGQVDKGSGQGQVNTISGQGRVDTGSIKEQPDIDIVSTPGQDFIKAGSGQDQVSGTGSRSGQGPVSSIRSGSGQGQGQVRANFNINSMPLTLAPQQQKIYSWFLQNGWTGFFNKGQIQRDTGINHPTIRKCITKLVTLNIIEISMYDPVSKQQKYSLNTEKKIEFLPEYVSSIGSRSGQGPVSSIRSGSGQGQVDTENNTNKLVSKYLNKLTNYLENSSFWSGQGLSVKKCEEWIKEFYPDDPEALITQLMFAEKTETVLKPKTKTSVHVFYGCLLNGGLTRPKDFEFPHERALRIKKQEIENQEKALAEIELLRQKEKMIADQLAFNDLLSNPENVDFLINEIENKFLTPKTKISIQTYRNTGKIDSKLENALKREFDKPDEE